MFVGLNKFLSLFLKYFFCFGYIYISASLSLYVITYLSKSVCCSSCKQRHFDEDYKLKVSGTTTKLLKFLGCNVGTSRHKTRFTALPNSVDGGRTTFTQRVHISNVVTANRCSSSAVRKIQNKNKPFHVTGSCKCYSLQMTGNCLSLKISSRNDST
jgi:hypothetical protein